MTSATVRLAHLAAGASRRWRWSPCVSVLIGAATTLAMRTYLTDQLDRRRASARPGAVAAEHDRRRRRPAGGRGPVRAAATRAPGTLDAFLGVAAPRRGARRAGPATSADCRGSALGGPRRRAGRRPRCTRSTCPALGSYRVTARGPAAPVGTTTVGLGLPTADVDDTLGQPGLAGRCCSALLGVLAAAGAAPVVVRRQLRPLREVAATAHTVAELPLASGEIDLDRAGARAPHRRAHRGRPGRRRAQHAARPRGDVAGRAAPQRAAGAPVRRRRLARAAHAAGHDRRLHRAGPAPARTTPRPLGTALDKVEEESGRMTSLVEDLLLLARLDSGRPLRARAGRPDPAAARGGLGRPGRRPRPPLAPRPARRRRRRVVPATSSGCTRW